MNLSAPFIKRPIATSLISIAIALGGILSFYLLPVAPLPQVEFPTILVQASLPGASPDIMTSGVTTPLEKQLSRISGITEMTSNSSNGSSRIIIQFDLSRNIDAAAREVQSAINAAAKDLPSYMPSPPTYRKVNPADAPIMVISLSSDNYKSEQLYDFASTQLQQRLLQVPGVGQVNIGGAALPAIRISLNISKLASYGISSNEVKDIIKKANINIAKGQITDNGDIFEISINDQIFKVQEYESLVIANKNNSIITLKDVATISKSIQDIRNIGLHNGKKSIALIIFKSPDANVIKTNDNITKSIAKLKHLIPAEINMQVVIDRTVIIKASLWDVEKTLIISMILVILVVYFFLRNIRSTVIPTIAMGLSLLGTFIVMKFLGFSLNNLSLMALTISTGFVIDDAIVVMENITRYLEKGAKPEEAALKGSQEIGFTVTSITLSLIAVFIPIIFMGGIIGRLFFEFAATLSIAIIISLFLSLTLTPVMCAKLLKTENFIHNRQSFIHNFYAKSLKNVLEHQHLMWIVIISTFVFSIYLFTIVPKGFFPQQDTGRIMGSIITDKSTSFLSLEQTFAKFINIIKDDDAVADVVGFTSNNSGNVFINLKPHKERKISADEVIKRLRSKLSSIKGANLYMQSAQDLQIGGRQGNAQFQYTIYGDLSEEVNFYAPKIAEEIKKIPGVVDVNNDQVLGSLESYIKIDYNKAAKFGISNRDITDNIYANFGQSTASVMYYDMNQYYVIIEANSKYLQSPESLKDVYIKSQNGTMIPLSNFATFSIRPTLLNINHQGLSTSATLSFNLLPNFSLGDAVKKVNETIDKMVLPITISGSFRGAAQAFESSLKNQPYLILAALIAVYVVLGMLYESLIHPITIICTLPSASVGALLALLITKTDLSIIALIGLILLIGIVKKNAIMMIDFVLQIEKKQNIEKKAAIYEAAILRFRPITMTSAAALLGAIPLAIGGGVGDEMRQPLGITIIGGLIFSQVITLYTTPIIYLAMEKLKYKTANYINKKEIVDA